MIIRAVEKTENKIIDAVVNIHLNTFKGFFLTFMGKGFLRQMYRAYCYHNHSNLLVAIDDKGDVIGFLAYSTDMSGLYKFMIKKRIIPFAWYSLGALIKRPKIFIRLIRAFLKPNESKREERYVKLTSIGVRPDVKSKGIGSLMIDKLKSMVNFDDYAYILLETDADNNVAANNFYLKNGFLLSNSYVTKEGRKMNEYHYQGNS
ncbi:MAG: GNAT family N-acetyltransferase [Clostridia bacterium]|nr:GNAT family N-acetyltransferase [Clostridia bacterium]